MLALQNTPSIPALLRRRPDLLSIVRKFLVFPQLHKEEEQCGVAGRHINMELLTLVLTSAFGDRVLSGTPHSDVT